jgi:hypothetical protein
MHPFLDVSKLTDEEIIERLGRAYTYMNHQVALGHDPTVHSIKEIIQDLEGERQSRLMKAMAEEASRKFPNMNAPIELGKLVPESSHSNFQPRDISVLEEHIRKLL